MQFSSNARILIAGQAPGRRVHQTGIPFNDPSGERLRDWLDVDLETFYDPQLMAILPMGFCFPGTGKSGDLPPRKECAPEWRSLLLERLNNLELVLAIGKYAHDYHLANKNGQNRTVTEFVREWREYFPEQPSVIPLPHPSPRNNGWLKRNPWFELELLPELRMKVAEILAS